MEQNKISYSAVVLDEESKNKCLKFASPFIPKGWKVICHHSTIKLGELPADLKKYIGQTVKLTVSAVGSSEKAFAFRVDGFHSTKKIPHITIAINESIGAKTKDSNDITRWFPLFEFELTGKIEEIPFKEK